MDYMFWQSIRNSKLKTFIVAYDIACQWSIHLKKRMFDLDHEFVLLNGQVHVKFYVGKWHLSAHVVQCRTKFSFNFGPGVGRTEGEAPERGWSSTNALAPSTKEMGPGTRRDTLDYHFGDHNWQKVTSMGESLVSTESEMAYLSFQGTSLKRKMLSAATDMAEHAIAHGDLTATIPIDCVESWTAAVKAWEDDTSNPNPYESTVKGTWDEMRLS